MNGMTSEETMISAFILSLAALVIVLPVIWYLLPLLNVESFFY